MILHRILWATLFGAALISCSRSEFNSYSSSDEADTLTHHAHYLTMADYGGGMVRVDISSPWKQDGMLCRYALVHRDSAVPEGLADDIRIIRVPMERAAVFSSVHTSALNELGALDCVKAIADASYFAPGDTITKLLNENKIVDLGRVSAPSSELIATTGIEALLRSPVEGQTMRLPSTVVPVECVDYMENSPIGRAEWILLLGELTGRRNEARRLFDGVIERYGNLVFKAKGAQSPRPKVLSETMYSGVWYVPAGESYMARMYADAGAEWPWADTKGTGSLPLTLENVISRALDADIWLVRSYGYEATPEAVLAQDARYKVFKALQTGLYSCNSAERNIFNDCAFHPDKVLAEYVAIFHPELMPGYKLQYFIPQF